MTDALAGDIVIDGNTVRFSDRVGHYVTNEQISLLQKTADKLGKFALQDRYPAGSTFSSTMETCYGWHRPCWRNEHGVPEEKISDDFRYYLKKQGFL